MLRHTCPPIISQTLPYGDMAAQSCDAWHKHVAYRFQFLCLPMVSLASADDVILQTIPQLCSVWFLAGRFGRRSCLLIGLQWRACEACIHWYHTEQCMSSICVANVPTTLAYIPMHTNNQRCESVQWWRSQASRGRICRCICCLHLSREMLPAETRKMCLLLGTRVS